MSLNEGLFRNHAAPHVSRPISFRRMFARLARLGTSLTRRKQIEALGMLDDRMLADMGVTRSDVQEAARWSLWGDPGGRLSAVAEERSAARDRATSALSARDV